MTNKNFLTVEKHTDKQVVAKVLYNNQNGRIGFMTDDWIEEVGVLVSQYGEDKEYVFHNIWETVIESVTDKFEQWPNTVFHIVDNHISEIKRGKLPNNIHHHPTPYFFLTTLWTWSVEWMENNPYTDDKITTHYCFLNGKKRLSRDKMWELFESNGLINDYCTYVCRGIQSDLLKHYVKAEWWLTKPGQALKSYHTLSDLPIYHDILIDLNVETSQRYPRLTEKSWKPLLCGKINLCFTGVGYYDILRDLGFQTHDNLIDYSFDKVMDTEKRMKMIFSEFKKLLDMPLDVLIEETREVREFNKNHCIDIMVERPLVWNDGAEDWLTEVWQGSKIWFDLCLTQAWEKKHLGRVQTDEERE